MGILMANKKYDRAKIYSRRSLSLIMSTIPDPLPSIDFYKGKL